MSTIVNPSPIAKRRKPIAPFAAAALVSKILSRMGIIQPDKTPEILTRPAIARAMKSRLRPAGSNPSVGVSRQKLGRKGKCITHRYHIHRRK